MFKRIGLTALVGATAVFANAGTMDYQGLGLTQVVHIVGGSLNGDFRAGTLRFNESSLGSIYSVCGDLYDTFGGPPASWGDTVSTIVNPYASFAAKNFKDSGSLKRAGNLVAFGFTSVAPTTYLDTDAEGAGLQIAVWAALYNTDAASLAFSSHSLTVGVFTISNISDDAITYANLIWSNRTNNGIGNSLFIEATGGTPYHGQDQITAAAGFHPTPEPFTMSLGVASVGLFLRRRMKKATA